MYVLCATFDPKIALTKVSDLLALGESSERLVEKLHLEQEHKQVEIALGPSDFKKLISDVEKLKAFFDLEKEIEQVESGKWIFSFLGEGFKQKKLKKLINKHRKFGSLIETPRWFYKKERVRLLGRIRDYAMTCSEQGDAQWVSTEEKPIFYPLVNMFETGNLAQVKKVATELEKPFGEIDPVFVLSEMEGHRTLFFDFEKNIVTYYGAIRGSITSFS